MFAGSLLGIAVNSSPSQLTATFKSVVEQLHDTGHAVDGVAVIRSDASSKRQIKAITLYSVTRVRVCTSNSEELRHSFNNI